MPGIFGIVNVTRDSFSDGGEYFAPAAAIAHAERLAAAGADVLDLGAESTHPDSEDVDAAEEVRRLLPVVRSLLASGLHVSVDTHKPEVMRVLFAEGVQWWNDVTGMRSAAAMQVVAAAPPHVRFVAMYARNRGPRAERTDQDSSGLLEELRGFCAERIAAFAAAGIARERLVLDPGMGFFLGREPGPSLLVLSRLAELQRDFGPLLVSMSRKSFLGTVSGTGGEQRGATTLAAELWAARAGVAWIRTHDVPALRAAWAVEKAIADGR